ncbi:hypothetical protein HerbRD11066_52330 [Herbidospora sp. RD11066]
MEGTAPATTASATGPPGAWAAKEPVEGTPVTGPVIGPVAGPPYACNGPVEGPNKGPESTTGRPEA